MIPTAKAVFLALTLLVLVVAAPPRPARTGEADGDAAQSVATGSVGESGPACMLMHRIQGQGAAKRKVVLRNVRSSLCPNTGAVALLVVNGEPRVHGTLTETGSSLHVEAGPGDRVIATVHTIPLFNGIECVRLGSLHLALELGEP